MFNFMRIAFVIIEILSRQLLNGLFFVRLSSLVFALSMFRRKEGREGGRKEEGRKEGGEEGRGEEKEVFFFFFFFF